MEKDLDRFLEAQENSFEQALAEIKSGKKTGHWIWYIFPQYKGLGFSYNSKYYAIQNPEEAANYLAHPVLGNRLIQITNELLLLEETNANKILGSPDDQKLKSSMTLFAAVDTSEEKLFNKVLDRFFNGQADNKTITLLNNKDT